MVTTITGALKDAAGVGVSGIAVTARLVATSELLAAGGQLIRATSTTSAASGTVGAWTLTLTPISALAYPTGAYYVVEAGARRWTITVPDTGTHELGTVLVTTPEERGDTGLTQTAGDARYVAKAGSTMTGALVLSGAPGADLQAATKKYVDDNGGGAVDSVFGRAGAVVAANGDYTAAQVGADAAGTAAGLVATEAATRAGADSTLTTAVNARLVAASNLGDLTNATTARTNLGLGNSATRNVGTASGEVAQGNHTHAGSSVGAGLTAGAAKYGLSILTCEPEAAQQTFGLAAGVFVANLVRATKTETLTTLGILLHTAGVTASGANGLALYTEAGVLINQTTDMSTEMASSGWQAALSTDGLGFAVVADTNYYLAALTHYSGTAPVPRSAGPPGFDLLPVNGHRPSLFLNAQATFPASFTPGSANLNGVLWLMGGRL